METTPGTNPQSNGSAPIAVGTDGVAQPVLPAGTPVTADSITAPIIPPPPASAPAPEVRPYKPIILDDLEPVPYDHGHGPRWLLLARRALAFLLDTVGIGFFFSIFGYNAMRNGQLPLAQDARGFLELFAIALGAAIVLLWLFETLLGTSIGKLLFGLHVRRTNGERADAKRIFWRNVFRILDVLLIGAILILFLRHRQRVGDKVTDTTVGRSPIGPFAPVTAILIIAGLSWIVVTYGGGADTLRSLQTQVQPYAVEAYQRVAAEVNQRLHPQ